MHKNGGFVLDIILERVLSLMPKKENGEFRHGAKKEFAVGVGFKSGEIVSDWIAGRSRSYEKYLYQISDKYGVSVEWLMGNTDNPYYGIQKETPPEKPGTADPVTKELYDIIGKMSRGKLMMLLEKAQEIEKF